MTRDDIEIVGDEVRAKGYTLAVIKEDLPASIRYELEEYLLRNRDDHPSYR